MRMIMSWVITYIGFIGMLIFAILAFLDADASFVYYTKLSPIRENIGITGNIPILLLFLILSVGFYLIWKFGEKLKTKSKLEQV